MGRLAQSNSHLIGFMGILLSILKGRGFSVECKMSSLFPQMLGLFSFIRHPW